MKKLLLFIIILLTFLLFSSNKKDIAVFSYKNNEIFDNYYIKFKDCDLNTNNFLDKLGNIEKDYKILEIVPVNSLGEFYFFYSNDLNSILNEFKNKYINLMINDSKYTTNICIKEIKINTSNYVLDNLQNNISFTY